ncbi:MAG: hypothetical protein ACR65X_07190 [Methylocystis sp.]|uniref:Uncharacterized protein n=1 Tax=Bradyrhizobium denitrificans TaxID=2734912 RepID=A0ABS5GCA9_9BRAD|nr:hypothetical protein [Bradyrhizobium denitrificans]MBR1138978.1 hypothetical protein [Bradyrhizobium denitrificans]
MVAAVATAFKADALAGGLGEGADHLRGNGLGTGGVEHGLGALGIGLGLVPDGLEAVDAVFQGRIVDAGHARLNGVVEALEAKFGFGGAFVQFGDVLAAAFGLLLPPIENAGEDGFQPLGLEKLVFEVTGDKLVELVHRHGQALASGRPLPCLH